MRNPIQVSRRDRTPAWDVSDFDDMFERVLRNPFSLFDEMRPTQMTQQPQWFKPGYDVEETHEAYLLTVDLPGMKKEDVKIALNDNVLTLSGERKIERNEGKGRYERSYGRFQQSFTLPGTVDVNRVEAHLEDGVLHIALPKSEMAKPRTIEVQTGKGGFFNPVREDISPAPR